MRKFSVCSILLLTLSLLLAACGAASAGPMTWLDRPLDGASLPLAPVTIQAHASDDDGVVSCEFLVDDQPLVTASAEGGRLGTAMVEWDPTAPGTYTIQARGVDAAGNVGSEAISVVTVGQVLEIQPTVPPESEEGEIIFFVDPEAILVGACAMLHWEVLPPAEALLDGESVPAAGDREVCPEETRVYELLVAERGQAKTATLHVEAAQEPTPGGPSEVEITFTADRTNIDRGECTTLRWSVQGGFGVELDGRPVERSAATEVCPEETTPYRLAVDAGTTVEEREVVIVVAAPPQQTAAPEPTTPASTPTSPPGCPGSPVISSFTANPSTITAGQSTTLSWGAVTNGNTSQLVGSVVINPALGEVGSPGSRVVSPGSTTTYTLVATGCGGTAQRQVTVTVNPAVFSADLAITDLYPETNYGPVWTRITNHGPGTINNVTVQLSCQWAYVDPIEGTTVYTDQRGPMPISIGSLTPGQTKAFNIDIDVVPEYRCDMTCTIQVPFTDPNPGNNTYFEQMP